MTTFTHTAIVELYDDDKGKRRIKPIDPEAFGRLWKRGIPGDKVIVGVKPLRQKKTPSQLGYLHGVVIPMILSEMGFEDSKQNHDDFYRKMKDRFGPSEIRVGANGEEMVFAQSMETADIQQMSRLIDGTIRWAGDFLGLTIPPPTRVMMDGGGI